MGKKFKELYERALEAAKKRDVVEYRESVGGRKLTEAELKKLERKSIRRTKGKYCEPPQELYRIASRGLKKKLARGDVGSSKLSFDEAWDLVGGMSETSKTGLSYGLPIWSCKTGRELAKIPGSTCAKCYASKGKYGTCSVKRAQARRLASLDHPRWKEAMAIILEEKSRPLTHYRWHDSGDLQSMQHLQDIVDLAELLPQINFWLPTKEYQLITAYQAAGGKWPKNLTLRVSASMIDKEAPGGFMTGSSVHSSRAKGEQFEARGAFLCPVVEKKKGNKGEKKSAEISDTPVEGVPDTKDMPNLSSCRAQGCTACWERKVKWVSYGKH